MLKICSRIALLVVGLGLLSLVLMRSLVSPSPVVTACQLAALALGVWARASFPSGSFGVTAVPVGTATIHRGPYRLIRHPMYAAALLLIWASIFGHLSPATAAVGVVVTAVAACRIVDEERLLRARFPDYAEYARSTRMLVPFLL